MRLPTLAGFVMKRKMMKQDRPLRAFGSRLQAISWVAQLLWFVVVCDIIFREK